MKGELSVDPIFTSLGIHRPTVFLKHPVVAMDNHRLHFSGHSIPWDISRTIINCTYCPQYQVLLLLCDDWKLYVYNQNLDEIGKLLNWQSKYTVGFEYIEKLGIMLMIGVSEVEVMKVNINTNIKKTKFLSSVKFSIEKKELIREAKETKLKWNKGYGYDLDNNLLFLWSLQDINFYSLSKLQLKSQIRNVVKKEEPITFVYFNSSYKYTVTGLFNGNVRVWRLPLVLSSVSKATTPNDYIMIHNCIYHTKLVEKIVATDDDRVIFSQSVDLTVCMWSLQTFELLRVYDFQGEYQKVMLYDFKGALAIKDNFLGELKFGKTMEFIMELSNRIITHDKTFQRIHKLHKNSQISNRIKEIQLTLSSNMGIQIKSERFKEKDLNKIDVDFFYPPLKSQEIKQVISCPFVKNRYYLLSETGKIYKVRMQGLSSIIEHYYSVNLTHDIENHPLNQLPTLIKFLNIIPAEFDSEIIESGIIVKEENSNKNQEIQSEASIQNLQQKFERLKLIAVGCNKGSIVFLPIENMDHIYTRITYHREQIISIETVYQESIKNSYLVSICSEKYMRFVKFDHQKAVCFRTIFLGSSLNFIKGFDDRLAVVLFNGLFEIMQFDSTNDELYTFASYDTLNHEGDIVSLDVDLEKEIVLTGGKDNRIKIWTYYKIQLYEISLDEGLKYAVFSNDYEILVSHGQKLLYIRDIPFSITKEQIDQYNGEFLESNNKNLLTIKEILDQKPWKKPHIHHLQNLKIKLPSMKEEINDIDMEYLKIKHQSSTQRKSLIKGNQGQKRRVSFIEKNEDQYLYPPQLVFQSSRKSQKPLSLKKRNSSLISKDLSVSEGYQSHRQSNQNQAKIGLSDLMLTKKHINEMDELKRQINKPILPRIAPKNEDIFESFMKDKLLNKKVLTRRDITLNRIIMKNIVKQNIGQTAQNLMGLKLDF